MYKNCEMVPLINPEQRDLCFMLDNIDDLRRKVESLCNLKRNFRNLDELVTHSSKKSTLGCNSANYSTYRH